MRTVKDFTRFPGNSCELDIIADYDRKPTLKENGLKEKIETLRWRNNKLEMIDQRILPARFEYRAFDSAAAVAEGIRSMVVRGAPAIGCAAAYGVALEALRLQSQNIKNT